MPGFRNESVGEIKVDTKGSTVSTNNINFSALENLNVMNEHIISPGEAETIDFSAIMPTDVETPVGIPDLPTDVRKKMDEEAGKAIEELNKRRNGETPVGIPDPPSDVRKRMDEDARRALEDLNKRRNGENPVPVPDPIGEDRKRMEEQERRALEDLRNARNSGSFEGGHGGGGGGGESW